MSRNDSKTHHIRNIRIEEEESFFMILLLSTFNTVHNNIMHNNLLSLSKMSAEVVSNTVIAVGKSASIRGAKYWRHKQEPCASSKCKKLSLRTKNALLIFKSTTII
jgi:hypothetical protein